MSLHTIVAAAVALSVAACTNGQNSVSTESETASPRPSCAPLKDYVPTYVPEGFDRDPGRSGEFGPGNPDRIRSWASGRRSVHVMMGVAADWGDDATVKEVKVLGFAGGLGGIDDERIAVAWVEQEGLPCHQYAVVGRNIEESELLRVARSLKDNR